MATDKNEFIREELDKIYERFEKVIDLDNVHDVKELREIVRVQKGKRRNNDSFITNLVFKNKLIKKKESLSIETKSSQIIGRFINKIFQYIYSPKRQTTYVVARDKKGRFTKYSESELYEAK